MPPPTPLPPHSIIQVRVNGLLFGQKTINTFHYKWNEAILEAPDYRSELTDFDAVFQAANKVYSRMLDCMGASVFVQNISYQPVFPSRLAAVTIGTTLTNGTAAGDDLPVNTCSVILRRADEASRRAVGTLHVPGLTSAMLSALTNDFAAGHLLKLDLLGQAMLESIPSGFDFSQYDPVLFSVDDPENPLFITQTASEGSPRVMRRRTKGIGI
jgi:hypothetical protein